MADGARRALARVGAHDVDGKLHRRPADHDNRHRGPPELVGLVGREPERGEDEAVDEPVPKVAHDRELVLGVGARRVEQEPPAAGAGDLLDRPDHRGVDRVADVRDREGDLPGAARAQ